MVNPEIAKQRDIAENIKFLRKSKKFTATEKRKLTQQAKTAERKASQLVIKERRKLRQSQTREEKAEARKEKAESRKQPKVIHKPSRDFRVGVRLRKFKKGRGLPRVRKATAQQIRTTLQSRREIVLERIINNPRASPLARARAQRLLDQ